MTRLVQAALEDDLVPHDVAELIATWPLIQMFNPPEGATIVIVGAYQGKVIEALLELYGDRHLVIHGFDPQQWALQRAHERLMKLQAAEWLQGEAAPGLHYRFPWQGNSRVTLWPFALGVEAGRQPMGEWETDACSFYRVGQRVQGDGEIRNAHEVLEDELNLDAIDLMVMNCEGAEWELLPYFMATRWATSIKRLAVQWHADALMPGMADAKINDSRTEVLDRLLAALHHGHGHRLVVDLRPAWTYSEYHEADIIGNPRTVQR